MRPSDQLVPYLGKTVSPVCGPESGPPLTGNDHRRFVEEWAAAAGGRPRASSKPQWRAATIARDRP
jgi:hypothetical protein